MDVRCRISGPGEDVPGSAVPVSPPLPPDSKALRSESDILATRARGCCGVKPRPIQLGSLNFSASRTGDWLYGERKRLVFARSSIFSIFAMLRFTALAV